MWPAQPVSGLTAARPPIPPARGTFFFRRSPSGDPDICEDLRRTRCLVAAEEARSGADGQHAQVPPRADAPRTRTRPALGGRRTQQLSINACLHGNPAVLRIPCALVNFHGPKGRSAGADGGTGMQVGHEPGMGARCTELPAWPHPNFPAAERFSQKITGKSSVSYSK
jgi:hypothetical protein